ncbi:hypothetical protein FY044_12925 [Leclercia adecarboxylata]|nr:hypothetical protein FR773_11955 [Leclercia adecarboxylata]QGP83981.1 hypothetical protein GLX29_12015 [Leclercia adecarboxylata]QIG29109.1 hypothetical protein FY044_12925 [Leclercia adecarboxylata]HAG03175.1 hypothetical protein [Leclercia adecarboxylata]
MACMVRITAVNVSTFYSKRHGKYASSSIPWVFYPLPPGCVFATHAIVVVHPRKREVVMLYVEKDDPREAPESGDKKPQPVKK